MDFTSENEPELSVMGVASTSEEISEISTHSVGLQRSFVPSRFVQSKSQFPTSFVPSNFITKSHLNNQAIRSKWYIDYKVPDDSYFNFNSKSKVIREEEEEIIKSEEFKVGQDVSAIEYINWVNSNQIDCRPKIFDTKSKSYMLVDTGAMSSCVPKQKNDVLNKNLTLRTADGKPMHTYGTRALSIKMGRKEYLIQAIITDVKQTILGMDLINTYKLGFEWFENDFYLIDKKAAIKKKLEFVTIKQNSLPAQFVEAQTDPEITKFEIACIKRLAESDNKKPSDEEVLKKVPQNYRKLIQEYDILKPNYKVKPKHNIVHRIDTNGPPCTSKVRPLPADKLEQVKKIFQEMENSGVITKVGANTNTNWSSALHVVRQNGQDRICGDYRLLNKLIVNDSYPLPLIRNISQNLHGAKVFTKIDLKKAYWNLPIFEGHKHKSTIVTPFGAYYFNRVPFGISSAPNSYQKAMSAIFEGIQDLFIYMDDLLIYSKSQEDHEKTVEEVLKRLHENGIAISLHKCEWNRQEVDYLGYRVSEKGLLPLPKKVDAILKIEPPKKQKDLLAFLGAANFWRRSLSGLEKHDKYHNTAALIQCLYDIATEKNLTPKKFVEKWKSDTKYDTAFSDAKQLLKNAANIIHLNPNVPLALFVDASDISIGGTLRQMTNSGWQSIGYYSKSLSDSQKKYSTFKKELYGLHMSIRHFLPEILGRKLTCYTDHRAICDAMKRPQLQQYDPQSTRQLLEISQFTTDIQHISGSKNITADYLSRLSHADKKPTVDIKENQVYQTFEPLMSSSEENTKQNIQTSIGVGLVDIAETTSETVQIDTLAIEELAKAQANCEKTQECLKNKRKTTRFSTVQIDGHTIICEMSMYRPRPVIPEELRNYIIKTLHYPHPGIKETIHRISSIYYWDKMRSDITDFVQKCHQCLSVKPSKQQSPHLGNFEVPEERFSHLVVDLIELPVSQEGHKYCFTVICRTTRYFNAYALKQATSENCMKGLLDFISHFGVPKFLSSDSGTQFLSNIWKRLETTLGIELKRGPLYRPQAVGMVEVSHRTFKNHLKAQILEFAEKNQKQWNTLLPWALLSMRASYRSDIKASPSELAHGLQPCLPGSIILTQQPSQPLQDLLQSVKTKTDKQAVQTANIKSNSIVEEPPDDVTHAYTLQHDKKGLDPSYRGPFKIKCRVSRSTVRLIVGHYANGNERYEDRHWSEIKAVKLPPTTIEDSRAKLGRPTKQTNITDIKSTGPPPSQPFRGFKPEEINIKPNIPGIDSIDFSKPPPNVVNTRYWSASSEEIALLNRQIASPA